MSRDLWMMRRARTMRHTTFQGVPVPEFSPVVTDYWAATFSGKPLHSNEYVTITVNPELADHERAAILSTAEDDRIAIVITPAIADSLTKDIAALSNPTVAEIRVALAAQGAALNDADNVFYLTESAAADILGDTESTNVRRLTDSDTEMFASFKATVSEEDWDGAYVELNHWAVFGAFDEQEHLVSIGSMYPWDDEVPLADLGVLTTSAARGRGHAKTLVRAMFRYALTEGYEPQYRCQLDNDASNKLAASLGLELFGRWEIVLPDGE